MGEDTEEGVGMPRHPSPVVVSEHGAPRPSRGQEKRAIRLVLGRCCSLGSFPPSHHLSTSSLLPPAFKA